MATVDVLRDFQLDRSAVDGLQTQLYQALKDRILCGRLASSTQLPSSRCLSDVLSVSRNTINGALEQLKAEGYLKTKQGAGHYVSDELPDSFLTAQRQATDSQLELQATHKNLRLSDFAHSIVASPGKKLVNSRSFSVGVPDLDAFPLKKWNQLYQQNLRTALMGYDSTLGYEPLRNVLADYLRSSRGLVCTPDQILITVGAQQATSIALQVLLNESDTAYVENPGYIGMRKAIMARGARIQGIDVGADGLDIEKLPQAPEGKVLCITPTHQYPMGGIMPLANRLGVLQWAADNGVWIIEDDYDSEYHYDHKPIAAMQGLGLREQVIYIGSFSKVLFPALRLGYMVVPSRIVDACINAKNYMAGQSPIMEQATVAEFIETGLFARHLRQMRLLYEEKLGAILSACGQILGDVVTPVYTGAGMHIVLTFNESLSRKIRDVDVITEMEVLKVYGSALSTYYVNRPKAQGLVLGFSNTDVKNMSKEIKKIRKVIDRLL